MKTLNTFLNEATIGEDMERAIVSMWNNGTVSHKLNVGIKRDGVVKIVDYLKKEIRKGEARKVKNTEVSVTDWWSNYSKEHTPKTDLEIGTYRISVKTGPAQLMSGVLKGDTKATFMTAIENTHNKSQLMRQIISMIEDIPKAVVISRENPEESKLKYLRHINKMNKELEGIMKTFFEKNPATNFEFVKEAMTGKRKFGTTSIGCAQYVLYCEPNGHAILHPIKSSYIKKVTDTTKMNVSFKSTSVKKVIDGNVIKVAQRKFSVVRLATGIVDKFNEEVSSYNGTILSESILLDIWNKITTWFSKMFSKIKEWIGDSMEKLLEFLGFLDDDDNIEVNIDDSSVDFS